MVKINYRRHVPIFISLLLLFFTTSAAANKLEVDADSAWILHFGALILLYSHIGGGALGLLSGTVASLTTKGGHIHRLAGKVFIFSMFVCYAVGAGVSPFLESQQGTNLIASILALYLLITGVIAARRNVFIAGRTEKIGFIVALLITVLGIVLMYLASQSPDGSIDDSPPQAYILFVVAGGLATVGDLLAIIRGKLSPKVRVARHLWRMCMSFFIASGSLFFGQAQFFPEWFNESILPLFFGFFPLFVLVIYLIKMTIQSRFINTKNKTIL